MLIHQDSQKSMVSLEADTPSMLYKKKSLKHRLKSLRRYVKKDSQLDYFMDQISEEKSESFTMTTHVLKQDIRAKLLFSIRYLCIEEAFQKMELPEVQEDLFQNASPAAKNAVFLWAAYTKRLDYMRVLHGHGADVNYVQEGDNFNALHLSALNDSVECCQWLLSQGCKFQKTSTGLSPLDYAAYGNTQKVLEFLIAIVKEVPNTVLNSAVNANSVECVKYLMSRKIGVNTHDSEGMAPLHIACDHNNIQCLKYLLSHPKIITNIKTRDKRKYTPLHIAAENGYNECIKILIDNNANVNECNNKKETALHLACKMQHPDCVDTLLKHKAAVNAQDDDQRTPVHGAVSKSRLALPIVQLLVKWCANVNAADRFGFTPLHIAASNELEECVEYLIMNGANVASRTNSGLTALNIINRKTPVSVGEIGKRLNLSLAYNEEQSLKFSFRDILSNSTVGEINYLYILQKEGQSEVLKHPLCRAFLHLKWQKIRPYYLFRVAISVVTVTLLSLYIMSEILTTCCLTSTDIENNRTGKDCPSSIRNNDSPHNCSAAVDFLHHDDVKIIIHYVILALVGLNILRVVLSLTAYKSVQHYFSKKSNILEIFITICIFYLCHFTVEFTEIPHNIGAITILSSWIYLMIIVGELPSFGTYVLMFTRVFKQFGKLLLQYLCLLCGFTMTLCVLFPQNKMFQDPFTGFVKVMTMMTGELTFDELAEQIDNIHMKHISFIILASFVIFVTVVLMNLLIGIAVHDVEALHKTADLQQLIHQTQLIHSFELTCFNQFIPKRVTNLFQKFLYVSPNMYQVVLYVRPLCPQENRLPRNIIEDGLKIALDRRKAQRNQKCKATLDIATRMENLENEIKKLQVLIVESRSPDSEKSLAE